MRRSNSTLKLLCLALCWQIIFGQQTALAHNAKVHEEMSKRAYQIMLLVSRLNQSGKTLGPPPAGVSMAQWKAFHADISAARTKLDKLTNDANPGSLTEETKTAEKLATATSDPDYYTADIHLFVKLTNALGQSAVNKAADEAIKLGAAVLLVPLVCTVSCLGELFGIGNGTCKKCIKKAKEISEDVPTPSDLSNLIPGLGDVTSKAYTGVWHFINMSKAPYISNTYDDHQGLLYEVAGPFGVPGTVDLGIMAITDTAGLSVNPEKSDGVTRYQIKNADDSFSDGDDYNSTLLRSNAQWQKYAMGHTTFEPLDNFGLWGWREFRSGGPNDNRLGRLGYPLHALGDATVPMHVTGTTSWGHRPYEDAQERLWDDKIRPILDNQAILAKAFKYRQEILAWQAQGHPGDVPIRHLIRTVAQHTFDYSQLKQSQTTTWPFNDKASIQYFVGDTVSSEEPEKDASIDIYTSRPDAAALVKPLFEDGIAAELALLISAGEASNVAQQQPLTPTNDVAISPASWSGDESSTRAVSANAQLASLRTEELQGRETPAQTQFASAVKINYALLGRSLILDEISPAEYLQRVRNQTGKANLASKDRTWAEEVAKGDADGDLVPDSRDRCPNTPPLVPTDETGCPTRERLPSAPSRRDMQDFFSRFNTLVAPKCMSVGAPTLPLPLKIGTSSLNRDLLFAVRPISNQSPDCPTYYEIAIQFIGVFEGDKSILPPDAYREVVFRNTDGKESMMGNQKRLVFRIVRDPAPQSAERSFMLKAWGRYNSYQWRVRAVSANGLSSDWSAWRNVGAVSFGEP